MTSLNIRLIIVGTLALAIAAIIFPIVVTGAEEVRTATNISEYTGMSSLVKIFPTVAFAGLLIMSLGAYGLAGYQAYRAVRTSRRSR